MAKTYATAQDFLFLGRSVNYPIALEGALKLKEISYIHAEGYPAGEMKHGPIALIDENMPVLIIVPADKTREKIMSNLAEVKARGGIVIALAQGEDAEAEETGRRLPRRTPGRSLFDPDPDDRAVTTAGLSCGRDPGNGCGSAPQPGQVRDGGVNIILLDLWQIRPL